VRIIAEPGRYYVASAFTLCVNIIAKRELLMPNGENHAMYYVNDGVYGSFNCLLYDHATVYCLPLTNEGRMPAIDQTRKCSVWGPTCDGLDRILENVDLPDLDVGQWLVFPDMGAYTVAAASTFNGFQKPPLTFVMKYSTWLYLQELLPSINFDDTDVIAEATDSPLESPRPDQDDGQLFFSTTCSAVVDGPAYDPLPLVSEVPDA